MPSRRSDHELSITTKVKDLASKELRQVGQEGKKSGESIAAGFIKAQLAIGAMKAAVRGALNFIKGLTTDVAAQGDEMAKLSRRLGLGIETLSAFGYAAKLGGSNVQEMGNALRFLQKAAYESTAEGGSLATAKRAFDALGVSVNDSSGNLKTAEQLFYDVADGMAKLGEGAKRTALAQQLFGRSGLTVIPIIEQGTAAIRAQIEEARRYGIVWTDTTGKIAEDFVDAQTRLDAAINGLKISIGTQLLPVLTEGLNDVANYIAENRAEVTNIALDIVETVSSYVFKSVRLAAGGVGDILDLVEDVRKALNSLPGVDLGESDRTKQLNQARAVEQAAHERLIEVNRQLYLLDRETNKRYAKQLEDELATATAAFEKAHENVAKLEDSIGDQIRKSLDETSRWISKKWEDTRRSVLDVSIDTELDQFFDFEKPARKAGQAAGEAVAEGVAETLGDSSKILDITRDFQRQIALLMQPDDISREWLKVKQTLADVVRQADLVGASADEVEKLYRSMLQFRELSREGIIDKALEDFFSFEEQVKKTTDAVENFNEVRAGRGGGDRAPDTFGKAVEDSLGYVQGFGVELGYSVLPTLVNGFDQLFSTITSGSASAADAFKAFANDVLRAVQRLAIQELVVQLLGSFFGGSGVTAKPIQSGKYEAAAFAAGGTISRPTIALMGESGREHVLPDSDFKALLRRGGGGGSVTLNQTIVAPPGTDQKAFAKTVVDMTLRGLRSSRGRRQDLRRQLDGGL